MSTTASNISLLDIVKELRPRTHGWCSVEKAAKLIDIVLATRPKVVVEIGTFGGASILPIILAIKSNGEGKAYGIDPWTTAAALEEMHNKDSADWWRQLDMAAIKQSCISLLTELKLDGYYELIQAKSEDVVSRWADNTIDILHIDGNHSEALSYKDAVLYLPEVRPGGFIFFDDIHWTEESSNTTQKAMNHLLHECDEVETISDCVLLQKRII